MQYTPKPSIVESTGRVHRAARAANIPCSLHLIPFPPMTIVVFCPHCGSKLNAKEELIGQTRSCPKCREAVLIQPAAPEPAVPEPAPPTDEGVSPMSTENMLGTIEGTRPVRLAFSHRYFILNPDRLIAFWESGKGWQLNVGNGFAPAKKNAAAIPDQGTFLLVELLIGDTPQGIGPTGMRFFRIIKRGALTALYRDESEILKMIEAPGTMTKAQKAVLLSHFQRSFMQTYFDGAPAIFRFLTDDDITSHAV